MQGVSLPYTIAQQLHKVCGKGLQNGGHVFSWGENWRVAVIYCSVGGELASHAIAVIYCAVGGELAGSGRLAGRQLGTQKF